MNETRPAASDRRRGGAHLRRGRGWSRSMVAGGLLAGLLLFAMAVLTQPRASAWTDPPEVHQDSAPADSDEESASSVDGKTGFEAQAADAVAADAAAALDEMAGSEQAPVAAAGGGSEKRSGGSAEVTPQFNQLVKPDEIEVPSAEGEQLPGGDEPRSEGETGTLPDWLTPVEVPEIAFVPAPPPPAAAPAPAAAEPQPEAQAPAAAALSEGEHKLAIVPAAMALTVPIALDAVPIHLETYNQQWGSNITLEAPFTVVKPNVGFYSFSAPSSWDGLPFAFWGAGEETLGQNPNESEWIWVGDEAIWAAKDPDSDFFSKGEKVHQVPAYYRLDVP